MDADYITALEYADKHGRSKAWIVKLCHAGRLPGAFLCNGIWAVPSDCPLPDQLKPGPKLKFDRVLAKAAMAQAKAARETQEATEREQVKQIGGVLNAGIKAKVDQVFAQGGKFNSAGSYKLGDRWVMTPDGWNEAAWLYYQSLVAGKPVEDELEPWPRTEAQAMRKFDIGEGVADGMTLDSIKAQVKHWGADEQTYYDSLVPDQSGM